MSSGNNNCEDNRQTTVRSTMTNSSIFLMVDVQVDFCPGGSLAVPGGDEIIPTINRYLEIFGAQELPLYASRDWHPPVTDHFRQFGGLWPPHCVRDSAGARFHPALKLTRQVTIVSKGMDPKKDDYSALQGQTEAGLTLETIMAEQGVKRLYVCGLATDYCVKETCLEALRGGFLVTLLTDAIRGVDVMPGDSERAIGEIAAAGGELADLAVIVKRPEL